MNKEEREWAKFEKDNIKALLNLYQKEKEKNKKLEIYENIINNREYTWKQKYEETFDCVKDEFISKDKIREKIKELEQYQEQHKKGNWADIPIEDYDFDQISLLKELLEEE